MDPLKIQKEKNEFAASEGIEACTNASCKFTKCTCGSKCGCNLAPADGLESCDPCQEFQAKKKAEMAAASQK
eukprot:CAMPEP_0176067176 /NCGR_PEP_ID=MMETSP0120_2-20121206/33528_1 /TAXON_ID=160619 /ORGANISM="Kryptoperidinium foliaceum, Strain CCMP 1326" /LENGTH=71 /DNA_ID=CAMNT_0017400789 /DNA_START=107 /DNA_END=322 /DNA_ORIENTATION=+